MKTFSWKTTLLTLLLVVIWGAVWPINKLAVSYTPPLLYAGLRTLIGGCLLAVIMGSNRHMLQLLKHWNIYLISAILNTVLFFGLHTIGLLYLPGGLFSVIVYIQPITLSLFAWLLLGEHFSAMKLLGLFLGFIGVFIASVDGIATHVSIIGVSLALLTGISWAFGVLYVKKVSSKVNAYWMVVMQNIIGGIILLSAGTAFESWYDIDWNPTLIIGIAYGVVFGVSIAYIIYYSLINAGEASKVGVATFLVPIISVIISVVFADEVFTYKLLIGMILVGLSIVLVNTKTGNVIEEDVVR